MRPMPSKAQFWSYSSTSNVPLVSHCFAALSNMVATGHHEVHWVDVFWGQILKRPTFLGTLILLPTNPVGRNIGEQGLWTCQWPQHQGVRVGWEGSVSKASGHGPHLEAMAMQFGRKCLWVCGELEHMGVRSLCRGTLLSKHKIEGIFTYKSNSELSQHSKMEMTGPELTS